MALIPEPVDANATGCSDERLEARRGRATGPRRRYPRPLTSERVGWGLVIGAGAALSGFTPFNHLDDVLDLTSRPYLVVLMPSVLMALSASVAAVRLPLSSSTDRVLLAASGLLLAAGLLSLTSSGDPGRSALLFSVTIVAPLALLWTLRRSDVSPTALCGAFVATVCLLLVRADFVFVRDFGLPSGGSLFQAKFTNRPYDFHYYTLNNPNQTATFLILVLPLVAFWAAEQRGSRFRAWLFAGATAFILVNVGLVYVRFAITVGVLVALAALVRSPLRRGVKLAATFSLIAGIAWALSTGGVWDYVRVATDFSHSDASAVVRVKSYQDGLQAMVDHPLSGVGLGEYGRREQLPAHSSLVQAGAETGLLGVFGVVMMLAWLVCKARASWRRDRLGGLAGACILAALLFWVYAMIFGGANVGLANGFVAIWGVGFAVVAGVSGRAKGRTTVAYGPAAASAWPAGWPSDNGTAPRGLTVATRWAGGRVLAVAAAVAVVLLTTRSSGPSERPAGPSERLSGPSERSSGSSERSSGRTERRLTASERVPDSVFYAPLVAPPLRPDQFDGPAVTAFDLTRGNPAGWKLGPGTEVEIVRDGLAFRTGLAPNGYQDVSDAIALKAGRYAVAAVGRISRGGVLVGVIDDRKGAWMRRVMSWSGQARGSTLTMGGSFRVRRQMRVRLVLANLSQRPRSSRWTIRSVELRDIGPDATRRPRR